MLPTLQEFKKSLNLPPRPMYPSTNLNDESDVAILTKYKELLQAHKDAHKEADTKYEGLIKREIASILTCASDRQVEAIFSEAYKKEIRNGYKAVADKAVSLAKFFVKVRDLA